MCKFNKNIKPLSFLDKVDYADCVIIFASTNLDIYVELKDNLCKIVPKELIVEIFPELYKYNIETKGTKEEAKQITKIGKYSYGPICQDDHRGIESIGNFCSFAYGVEVVPNHEMKFITTHPMLYAGKNIEGLELDYSYFEKRKWYFEGVSPNGDITSRMKRSVIGNDVWLGQNVIITNGARIGNGVITGDGSIITKDVPDYAVVVGVPAKIIRFRYTLEQINALNKIEWWNWSDEQIRERYEDFYLPIEQFIEKYI